MRLVKRILRSDLVWRLSGLTYYSAVIATHGYFEPPSDYVASCKKQMDTFSSLIAGCTRIVEFGSGLGGNLIAVANLVSVGYGIDINPFYPRIAKRIARRVGVENVHFMTYNGRTVPRIVPAPDIIFSFGVFERLPKAVVRDYIAQLRDTLHPEGRMILSFLTVAALQTSFVNQLGADAYVPWTAEEIRRAARDLRLELESLTPHGEVKPAEGQAMMPVALVGVFHKSGIEQTVNSEGSV